MAAGDPFHAAFTTSTALVRRARSLGELEYRFARRFGLWDRLPDGRQRAQLERLHARQREAVAVADAARARLNGLWTDLSHLLPADPGIGAGQRLMGLRR